MREIKLCSSAIYTLIKTEYIGSGSHNIKFCFVKEMSESDWYV